MAYPEPISPELVLVDPELRARVLAESASTSASVALPQIAAPAATAELQMAPPRDRSSRSLPRPVPSDEPTQQRGPGREREVRAADHARGGGHARVGRAVSAALTAAILVIVLGVPLLALLPPRNAPHFVAPAQAGGSVATITWLPAPSADYYVLQITAGRVVVHASVHPGLSAAVPQDLAPGRYGWRVLPGTGTVAEGTVGTPVARGVFTVGATQAGD